MNPQNPRYNQYALIREMLESAQVIRNFDPSRSADIARRVADVGRLMLTGEGSSRIFPAKNAIRKALGWGAGVQVATEGSRQAAGYDLSKFAVFGSSNSGRTAEVVTLMSQLQARGHQHRYGLTANSGTVLESVCNQTLVLKCGWEKAVAATKSVMEQALVYQSLVSHLAGRDMKRDLAGAAEKVTHALTVPIDPEIVASAASAGTIYFAGLNDGVAEELTLKTNEIAGRKADFLEGTYAVHGIEEVMEPTDIVVVIDPIRDEIEKFKKVLSGGVGLKVVAIATEPTVFETIVVPDAGEMNPYVFLAAGWNLLVEIGLTLKTDFAQPRRARKVGNEFMGTVR